MLNQIFRRPTRSRRRPSTRPRHFEKLESRTLLTFLVQIGGTANVYTPDNQSQAIDADGNTYIGGFFLGTADFDPGPGTYELTSEAPTAFAAKYDANGTLQWARAFDIEGRLNGLYSASAGTRAIALDGVGGVYVTGRFNYSMDFTGDGTYVTTGKYGDAFIVKLDSSTGDTTWARTVGAENGDRGSDIAVADGHVYITGTFDGTVDFDPGSGIQNLTSANNSSDSFVLKLDTAGNYVHAWSFGAEWVNDLVLDGSTIFVTGDFGGTADFDPSSSEVTRTSAGSSDNFFVSYTTSGELNWVQSIGNEEEAGGTIFAVNESGLYVTASTAWLNDLDLDIAPGESDEFLLHLTGEQTSFVARYSKTTGLLDTTFMPRQFGGSSSGPRERSDYTRVRGQLTFDSFGDMYVGISYKGTVDVDPGPTVVSPPTATGEESIVLKLDASGNYLNHWHSGGYTASPVGLINNTLYIVGNFSGTASFPTGDTLTSVAGSSDIYLLGLTLSDPPQPDPGVTVTPTSGLVTGEDGSSDTFTVVLDVAPTADVTIGLSWDSSEGTVSPSSLTFTSANWNLAQLVTVTGVDDPGADGDITYDVVTAAAVSSDLDYNGLDAADVSVTNLDNDATMHVADLDANTTSARGGKWNATITITVHDANDAPISGAAIIGSWSAGASGSSTCTTIAGGQCSLTKNNISKHSSSATFTVDTVSHVDSSYQQGDNHDPDGDSDGTTITVTNPASGASISASQFVQPPTRITEVNASSSFGSSGDPAAQPIAEPFIAESLNDDAVDAAMTELTVSDSADDDDDVTPLAAAIDELLSAID